MAAPLIRGRIFTNYFPFAGRNFTKAKKQTCKATVSDSPSHRILIELFSESKVSSAVSHSFVAKQGSLNHTAIPIVDTVVQRLQQKQTFLCIPCLTINRCGHSVRMFCSSSLSDADLRKEVESLSEQFVETRELLDDARNSFGSVYFNEDLSEAQQSLSNTLEQYSILLEKLSDSQREQVTRTIGLKMEELKAQQNMIMETIRED